MEAPTDRRKEQVAAFARLLAAVYKIERRGRSAASDQPVNEQRKEQRKLA